MAEARWLQSFDSGPAARMRLFCFPYAGGGPAIFRSWSRLLPRGIEVCAIHPPGRAARFREEPIRRVPELAAAAARAAQPYLDRPFGVFGHSMGAVVGFEFLRALRRLGAPTPRVLIASASAAPHRTLCQQFPPGLSDEEFVAGLSRLGGTPPELIENRELMQLAVPGLRADFEALGEYRCAQEPPLPCPISVFGGLRDAVVRHETLEAWREHTEDRFSLEMIPGDHFFLNTAPGLFLSRLGEALAGVMPAPSMEAA